MKKLNILFILIITLICVQNANAEYSVLIHPESHIDLAKRKEFTLALVKYKEAGYRYLGMEMFKDNRQNELDLYMDSPSEHLSQMRHILDTEWEYNTDSYMEVIDQAIRLGFKIIALDMPKNQVPKEVLPFPVMPEVSNDMNARNARMGFHIAEIIKKDEDAKIVVLVGSYHAKSYGIPKVLNETYGIFPIVEEN